MNHGVTGGQRIHGELAGSGGSRGSTASWPGSAAAWRRPRCCMAQVVKSHVAQTSPPQGSFPRRLDPSDRLLVEREDDALGYAPGFEVREEPLSKWNLAR